VDAEQVLLKAIRANPDDDLAYRALADRLEEQGEVSRAEFMRVQGELARLLKKSRRRKLEAREHELLRLERASWLAPFAGRFWMLQCGFRRGLVETLSLGTLRSGEEADVLGELRVLLSRPIVGAVRSLVVSLVVRAGWGAPLGEVLAQSPSLGGLTVLQLDYPGMGDAGLANLAASEHLRRLRRLGICDGIEHPARIGTAGLQALAASPGLRLAELELTYERVDDDGGRVLADSPVFEELECLSLIGNHLGDAGAQALAGARHWRRLRELDLSCNRIGDAGLEALANWPVLAGVKKLDLGSHHLIGDNTFGDRGLLALVQSPYLEEVEVLHLGETRMRIDAEVWNAVRGRFGVRLLGEWT
jgi:uncharacterized protein (TIGR02996 family)